MTDEHIYPEPDDEEGFLYVREWEDHRLKEETLFLARLLHAAAMEMAFRADHPEARDGTGHITASDVEMYEMADDIVERFPNLAYDGEPGERDE